jgi:hypothetical protein
MAVRAAKLPKWQASHSPQPLGWNHLAFVWAGLGFLLSY